MSDSNKEHEKSSDVPECTLAFEFLIGAPSVFLLPCCLGLPCVNLYFIHSVTLAVQPSQHLKPQGQAETHAAS